MGCARSRCRMRRHPDSFSSEGSPMQPEQQVQTAKRRGWKRLLAGSLYATLLLPVPALALAALPGRAWHGGGVDDRSLFALDAPAGRVAMAQSEQQAPVATEPAPAEGEEAEAVLEDWTETGPI